MPYITFGKPQDDQQPQIPYSRTLDQYPYHNVPDTKYLDFDQVASRAVANILVDTEHSSEEYLKFPDILLINQFCLWVIDGSMLYGESVVAVLMLSIRNNHYEYDQDEQQD